MADPMSGPVTRCPWCSAPLPNAVGDTCPSCGAHLVAAEGSEPQLPGVTTIDAEAILRARAEVARPRSRILSFITGEAPPETGGPSSPESLAPPSDEVRREMLRLQLAAEIAELEGEAAAIEAEARLDRGGPAAQAAGPDDPDPEDPPGEPDPDAGAPAGEEAGDADPPEDRSAL